LRYQQLGNCTADAEARARDKNLLHGALILATRNSRTSWCLP
jgi:hypothetical protein